jgi:hypothetical protein
MNENGKVRPVETITGMGGRRMEEVNSAMIYCKNSCKCHNVPPPNTTII